MDPGDQCFTLDEFSTWKVDALRDFLTRRGLSKDGSKSELAALCFAVANLKLPVIPSAADIIQQNKFDYKKLLNFDDVIIPDPLSLFDKWLGEKNGVRHWPPIYISDIVKYLMCNNSDDKVKTYLNDYKIGKAYEYFQAGFLKEVFYHSIETRSKYCILRCKCTPSQRIGEDDHDVWICANKTNGEIKSAYCTCTAGLGSTCNHVAGLLFRVEAANKLGISACTSAPCTWKIPSGPVDIKSKSVKLKDIVINKSRHGKSSIKRPLVDQSKLKYSPLEDCTTNEMVTTFAAALKNVLPNACFFMGIDEVVEERSVSDVNTTQINTETYTMKHLTKEYSSVTHFVDNFPKYSQEEVTSLSEVSRGQWQNAVWHDLRKDRITSSNFYNIHTRVQTSKAKVNCDFSSLVSTVMGYTSPNPDLRPLKHGRETEPEAKSTYEKEMFKSGHKDVVISECGLFIDKEKPYLGTSPDLLVTCTCCGEGVVEIKCPLVVKCGTCSAFCLCSMPKCLEKLEDGRISLRKKHSYYGQIQGQLSITGRQYCDFFIYTCNGTFRQRIFLDRKFVDEMFESLTYFFVNFVAPEIFSRANEKFVSVTNASVVDNVNETMDFETTYFCPVCRNVVKESENIQSFRDQSISCDVCGLWYHFKCVGVTKSTAAKSTQWVCKQCATMTH